MSQPERFDVLVLGSGTGGKLIAWHMARLGQRTAVVERQWIGGSCPNIACMPSKNEIRSAEVAHLARHAAEFGTMTGSVVIDMATVRQRKREMVERQVAMHLENYKASGAQMIMGSGRFVAPKTLEVRFNDGGTRVLTADRSFSTSERTPPFPSIPGLEEARPLTHIEALELDYLPLASDRDRGRLCRPRIGASLSPVRQPCDDHRAGPQLMGREDPDVAEEMRRILSDEGIQVLCGRRASEGAGPIRRQGQPPRAHGIRRAKNPG